MDNKLLEQIQNHVCALIADNAKPAEDAALKAISEAGDDDKPLVAKLALAIKWEPGSRSPKVDIKCSYATRITHEFSERIDLDQLEMNMEEN